MVFILDPFLISPPDGLDSAQILSKFQLQFLRLMALPGIEESSYLDRGGQFNEVTVSRLGVRSFLDI